MALLFLAACGRSPQPVVIVVATPSPATTPLVTPPLTSTPAPSATPTPTLTPSATPAGWETVAEGVQTRLMVGSDGGRRGEVLALRLDPARIDVQLRFDPERPRRVATWFANEQPLAALNAGFFDRANKPVGRWVIDDVTFGRGHRRMQGEFRISGAGVSIVLVRERDETDGTRTIASVEAYPFLLLPGGVVNPCLIRSDDPVGRRRRPCASLSQAAARLVVGIDGAGHLLFLLAPAETFTLGGLANWLKQSDLNLDTALNLDGGSSAGMLVQAGGVAWGRDSGRDVPGAFVVRPKVFGLDGGGPP